MDSLDVKKLIRLIKKGDVSAFDRIFNHYNKKVFNFCNNLLGKEEDAEEITQEVFIALWQNRDKLKITGSLSTYIYTIARNHIYHIYRKAFYIQSYIRYLENNSKEFDYVTEDQLQYDEMMVIMNNAIEGLPPKRKEIFKLSRFDGLSYRQIASRLRISENTVDVQLRKAIGSLRTILENYR